MISIHAEIIDQKIAFLPHIHNLFEARAMREKSSFDFLENIEEQLKYIVWNTINQIQNPLQALQSLKLQALQSLKLQALQSLKLQNQD